MQSSSSSDHAVSRNRVISSRTIEPGESSVTTTRITSSKTEHNEPVVRTRVVKSQVSSSSRGSESGEPVLQTRVVEMNEPIVRTRVVTSEESSGEPLIRTTRVMTSKSDSSSEPVVRTRVVTTRGESNQSPVVRTRVITSRGESGAGDTVVQTRVISTHKGIGEPVTRTTRVVELGEPVTRTTTRVVELGEPVTRTTTKVMDSGEHGGANRSGESRAVHTTRVVKKVSSTNGENKTFTETTVSSSKGASPQMRTVTSTSTKLVTSPKKSKISDIITGIEDETVTAREALLKWAQRTTERYPGVKITDFTKSWKDGLAFNAILHRNKPDLLDFRSLKAKNAKENLDLAFSLAEKEFGITRLLDPEDVDTPEADEKSLITYISSIYDVFPEPSSYHPFTDDYEKNRKVEEYKELAKNLLLWMEDSLKLLKECKTSKSLIDMKGLLLESSKFRSEELPKWLREKQRLSHLYRDIQKSRCYNIDVNIQKGLEFEELEKTWNKVTVALQERDQKVRDEIYRLEKLQRLAEKINRDLKLCEGKVDDVNKKISEEKRIQRLHQVDIKHNFDQLEEEFKSIDDLLKVLHKDIHSLEEKGYKQISEIKSRFETSKDSYQQLKMNFESGLLFAERSEKITFLDKKVIKHKNASIEKTIETNDKQFMSLKEHFDWIEKKHKHIDSIAFGNDYQATKANLELMKMEQKSIEQYKKKVETLVSQKNTKEFEDLPEYEDLQKLQSNFKVLMASTLKKRQDIENLMDFVQSASRELKWMNDKEELEIGRDWSSKNLNIVELEKHQETLTSDLEKHEIQFNAVQSRGESLLLQKHPALKIVEGYLKNMQNKWSWLLQLTFCLEVHLRHAQQYHKFFRETRDAEQWMKKVDEKLNTTFNKTIFSIDEGEQYLKQMEKLKEDITKHSDIITSLLQNSNQVVPLKQRRLQTSKPVSFSVISICNYTPSEGLVSKDDKCLVKDISHKMWKVQTRSGKEITVPSVCFVIPPPNAEAVEIANSLKKNYDDLLTLWVQKQRKLRQNLILVTIKVVKAWDLTQFRKMDTTQRDSIIRALNSDVQKLIQECTDSSEPALIKLNYEMEQCNTTFEALTNQISDNENEKSPKSAGRKLSDSMLGMQSTLNEKEKFLRNKLSSQIAWDLDSLENLVVEHKDFDNGLRVLEDQVAEIVQSFRNTRKKTTAMQMKHDNLVQTWDKISKLSNSYIEKLKLIDVALNQFSEITQTVSNIEVKLASCNSMPSDLKDLEKTHDNLLSFQEDMQFSQKVIDDAQESSRKLRESMKKVRSKQDNFADLNKFDNDLKKHITRLENARVQIIERLRSCGASSELLRSYKNKVEEDNIWISETTVKLNNLKTVKKMTTKEIELTVEPAMNLYSTIYEKRSTFEERNTLGARYIREAKIYDLRLKHYKESLEEEHPSLDASLQKGTSSISEAVTIQTEIELLNEKYSTLMQTVLDYLAELKDSLTTQQMEKWLTTISGAVPISLKYNTSSTVQLPSAEETDAENLDPLKKHLTSDTRNSLPYIENTLMSEKKQTDFSLKSNIANYRNRLFPQTNECAVENICASKEIFNSLTGKMVTLYEATEENIFDFKTSEICDLRTGTKMSLKEASLKGFIDKKFCDRILSKCGIYFPGTKEDLCIVEAVKQNLYDIQKGTLLNPQDKSPITLTDAFHIGIVKKPRIKTLIESNIIKTRNLALSEAIENKVLDDKTGIFHEPLTGQAFDLKLAVSAGYIDLMRNVENSNGLTLAEAIDHNLLQNQSGHIIDPDSGFEYELSEAIQNGILNPQIPQIADVKHGELLSISSALSLRILNSENGRFMNNKNLQQLTLLDARKGNFIWRPLSLKHIIEQGFFKDNCIICPVTGKNISILKALSCGVLDFQSKSILDLQSNQFISIPDALIRGIILPSCKYFDSESNNILTLPEAVDEGLIASVESKMIFDIEGIKDVKNNEIISFNTALERKVIDLNKELFINSFSRESCKLDEATAKGFMEHQIHDMLYKSIGVNDGTKVLNLIECCKKGYLDSKTGFLKDPKSQQILYIQEAINLGIITPEGAAFLKGLLNITVTMASVTRKVIHNSNSLKLIIENIDPPVVPEVTSDNIFKENILGITKKSHPEICQTSVGKIENFDCNTDSKCHSILIKSTSIPTHEQSFSCENNLPKSNYSSTRNISILTDEQQKFNVNNSQCVVDSLLNKTLANDFKRRKELPSLSFNEDCHDLKTMTRGTGETVQILELPPNGWDLEDAIKKRLFNPETGIFTVPGTDRLVLFEETVKMEIINSKSAYVLVPYSKQRVSLDSALKMKILDKNGCYGSKTCEKISMQKAIAINIVTFSESRDCNHKNLLLSPSTDILTSPISGEGEKLTMFPFDLGINKSGLEYIKHPTSKEFPLTVLKNYQNDFSESNVSVSFWPKPNQANLSKIPQIYLSPKDATAEGFIDQNTADILTQFFNDTSSNLLNSFGMEGNKEDTNLQDKYNNLQCKIPDYRQGIFVSLKDALNNGLLDMKAKKLLLPVACSLSVNEIFNQGLIDKVSNKVIHPESGIQLTIEEAILCDILNPYSFIRDPLSQTTMTIADSINAEILNPKTGDVVSSTETISLLEANHRNLFQPLKFPFKCPPLLALTFPTALQYGHIDIDSKEYIHPTSNQRISLQKAFSSHDLLSIPVQPQREYFLLDDAINRKLIESVNCTFTHPVTGNVSSVRKAMQSGLLVTKPVRLSLAPLAFLQEHLPQNEFSGNRNISVCIDNSTPSISNSCALALLDTSVESSNTRLLQDRFSNSSPLGETNFQFHPVGIRSSVYINKYSISEVFNNLYDSNTGKFQLPNVSEKVSFEYLIRNNYVNLDTLLFNTVEKCPVTLKDAILKNNIDIETGNYINKSTGEKMNINDAVKLGYLEIENVQKSSISQSFYQEENKLYLTRSNSSKNITVRPNYLALENMQEREGKNAISAQNNSFEIVQSESNVSIKHDNCVSNEISSISVEKQEVKNDHNLAKLLDDSQVPRSVKSESATKFSSLTDFAPRSCLSENKEIIVGNNKSLKRDEKGSIDNVIKKKEQHTEIQTTSNSFAIEYENLDYVDSCQNNIVEIESPFKYCSGIYNESENFKSISTKERHIVETNKIDYKKNTCDFEDKNENLIAGHFISDRTNNSFANLPLSIKSSISSNQDTEIKKNVFKDINVISKECATLSQLETHLLCDRVNNTFSEKDYSKFQVESVSFSNESALPVTKESLQCDQISTRCDIKCNINVSNTIPIKIPTSSINSMTCIDESSRLPFLESTEQCLNKNRQLIFSSESKLSTEKMFPTSENGQLFSIRNVQNSLQETSLCIKEANNPDMFSHQVSPIEKSGEINNEDKMNSKCPVSKIICNLESTKSESSNLKKKVKDPQNMPCSKDLSKKTLSENKNLAKVMPTLPSSQNKPPIKLFEKKIKEHELTLSQGKMQELQRLSGNEETREFELNSSKRADFSTQNPAPCLDSTVLVAQKDLENDSILHIKNSKSTKKRNCLEESSKTSLSEPIIPLDVKVAGNRMEPQSSIERTEQEDEKIKYQAIIPEKKLKLPLLLQKDEGKEKTEKEGVIKGMLSNVILESRENMKTDMIINKITQTLINENISTELMQEPVFEDTEKKLSSKSISETKVSDSTEIYSLNTNIKTESMEYFSANQKLTEVSDLSAKLIRSTGKEKQITKSTKNSEIKTLITETIPLVKTPLRQSVPSKEQFKPPVDVLHSPDIVDTKLDKNMTISSDNLQLISIGKSTSDHNIHTVSANDSNLLLDNAKSPDLVSLGDITMTKTDFDLQSKAVPCTTYGSFENKEEIAKNVESNNKSKNPCVQDIRTYISNTSINKSDYADQQKTSTKLSEVDQVSSHTGNDIFEVLEKSKVEENCIVSKLPCTLHDFNREDQIRNMTQGLEVNANGSTKLTNCTKTSKGEFDEKVLGPSMQLFIPECSEGKLTDDQQENTSNLEPMAVEENYKVCQENTSQLELWLNDIENKLADLGIVQENLPELQLQINTAEMLRKELENKQNLIITCLDQMRNLAQRGLEVLSKEEIDYLQKTLISLRRHYDLLSNESEMILKRLISAFEELKKFKSEVQSFKLWMNEAKQDFKKIVSYFDNLNELENRSEYIRSFTNDVIAHQADLRFLTMAGQKFIDESQDYLKALNAFRSNTSSKMLHLKTRDSEIKSDVQEITTLFHNFLNEVNKLGDTYATICSKYHSYNEVLERAKIWLVDIKKSSTKVISEVVADEPFAINEQLDKLKLINMEVVGQCRIIENVSQSAKILFDTLENCKVASSELKTIENNKTVVMKEYSELLNHIGNRIQELQVSLIQSQDIQSAVDRILQWLEETESTVKLYDKPISLLIDKLEEEVSVYKILKSDVENQKKSIGMLESSISTQVIPNNSKLVKKVDIKLRDVSERYDNIIEKISKRSKHLEEVSENVHRFEELISKFKEWCAGALQRMESIDTVHHNDIEGFSSAIEYVLSERESKKGDFELIQQIGKDLCAKKNVCDIKFIKNNIESLELQWKQLDEVINEKKQLGKVRFEQLTTYDALRSKVLDYLLKMELGFDKLEPLAVDHHLLKSQAAEIMYYLKEHSEYSSTIDKLNKVGNACESILRDCSKDKASSPSQKLKSSPTRQSPSKLKTNDNSTSSLSPNKVQEWGQSPLSTVSSGFGSRQSSVDNIGGLPRDLSVIQQQLSEINDRYNLLGRKISDRNQEITKVAEGIRSLHNGLKCLLTYIDELQKQFPKENISLSKGVIDKNLKNLKNIENEMLEKQPEVYNLKMNVLNILSKRKDAKGATDLQKEFNDFEEKWTSLLTSTKQYTLFLEDIKEFQELQLQMTNWLNQKEKMFQVLGPIASEPRMVFTQCQQVQVMRDEFTTQKSFMDRLIVLSTAINEFCKRSSSSDGKIEKQKESVEHKWNDMYGKLVEREKKLETASGVAKDFHRNVTELQGKIQEMSDKFESFEEKGYNTETLRKKLLEMEDGLDNLRPLLSDAYSVSEEMCDVLSDSSSKSEIKYKITLLEKSYETLRKKIDNKKAEVESSLKEDKVFFKCCEDIELWLNVTETSFAKSESMSENTTVMLKKIEAYETLYSEIMNKEHEIYLCLSKGADMLLKLPEKQQSAVKVKLNNFKKQFERIKKIAIEKRTTLRNCLENCKKYRSAIDTFVPWLESAEEKFIAMKPSNLKREVLNKTLKEVEVLRSELLSVHHPKFQNIQQLGEVIISNCEHDKENIKKELGILNKKWKSFNNEISVKIQLLEEVSQVLVEFDENFRDIKHKIERLEDKMGSHEAVGNVPYDAVFLDRLKVLLEEAHSIKSEIKKIKKHSLLVIEKAGSAADASEITKNIKDLESRHMSITKKIEDRCTSFSASYKVVSVFMDEVRSLRSELSQFDESFHQMQPISRDLKTLKEQLKNTKELKSRLLKTKQKYSPEKMTDSITKEDYIAETKNYVEQVNSLTRQISRLEEHITERETIIETMTTRIENFYNIYSETEKKVKSLIKKVDNFEVVVGDVDIIHSKQKNFKEFHSSEVIPLSKYIVEVNKVGHGLVQSATTKVDTSDLDEKIETLNNNWNNLQEMINEKEKNLDIALLQSGKLQEALCGVERWLIDTEEMVSNQKAPSFEFKVCKAQIQEQKFLKKMLLDRQNSVTSLKAMESEFKSNTKTTETEQTETLLKSITSRFGGLISVAEKRMIILEKTIPIAQEFESISAPLTEWLETVDKRLVTMSSIPIEESKIKKVAAEHKQISKDIVLHKKTMDKLNSVVKNLTTITVDTDSDTLNQKISCLNEKFKNIKAASENVGSLLKEAESGIGSFSASYKNSVSFIEETTQKLTHFDILSVHFEKLKKQHNNLKILKEKLNHEVTNIESVITSGENIMKFVSGEDSIIMKEKLDTLKAKTTELSHKLNERFITAETSLSLVKSFDTTLNKLTSQLDSSENTLKTLDKDSLDVQSKTIKNLKESISELRCMMDVVNQNGSRLCQMSTGESSLGIENQMTRINQRFESISEQVQRKDERIHLILQRKFDIVSDMDELSDWFEEVERKVSEAEGLSSEPNSLKMLLKEQKCLCDELNGQKNRVRDVVTTAKKLMRESTSEDLSFIHEKIEDLKTRSNNVSTMCQEKFSILEQALPLAQHFYDTHSDLCQWLDEVENQIELLEAPALNSAKIKKQQDKNKDLTELVQDHKPLVDKLNKTGSALTKLCHEEHSSKLEVILESDNSRYNALRKILREHQDALEEALQATSQFSDKLEGILNALTSTADQLHNAEPISAHPERIQEQINDNRAVLQDLDKRTITLEAVKKAADDVITKASTIDEPAVKDIQTKLNRLNDLYATIEIAAHNRGKSLEEALVAAEKFWNELTAVMKALKELQGNLKCQDPPAVEPAAVQQQQEVLQEIKQEITQTKPEVDHCREAGKNLMELCGEPDKPDVQKHIEDLDSVWENVTTLYAKREQNLVDAMEKAMIFHDTLSNLLEFLDTFEEKFGTLGAVSSDIDSVKKQISQLKHFKMDVDPHMIDVEALNRQAQQLLKSTSSDQAISIREPLMDINKRWNDLLKNIVERQREMENTLLKLGQFQHALEEQLVWITKTEKSLDDLKPILGDSQVIEIVLAKHKVISNDIQAHQSSMDMINRAGHEFVDSDYDSEDAKSTQHKLQNLLTRWKQLQTKSSDRYQELEEALKEAQKFHQEIQDLLMWLNELDGHLVTSKPVGGLPETAQDQLNKFMDLYSELDINRYKVEDVLQQGLVYQKKAGENTTKVLEHNLRMLKQKWDAILNKANDRKIKLEIALREAIEFNETLQQFVEWLTKAEKYIVGIKPVSRLMKTVLEQIEEHRNFQKEVGANRELMLNLDKKGTHLKYFSQKQDVILIKNLLQSVQHRWERILSKAADRTRSLDHGYKESKEFHDAYSSLSAWLDETEKVLDTEAPIGNDPIKIKKLLSKHKEFQRNLSAKQVTFDSVIKSGRLLKDKCPKQDVPPLTQMLEELKMRWNKICVRSVDKQRKLEEALLHSGQFKDAVLVLMEWIDASIKKLSENKPYHGDLDTVNSLVDEHKAFEEELKNRGINLESVCKTAIDLKKQASETDVESINSQIEDLKSKWEKVIDLSHMKRKLLLQAQEQAEKLYKMVHVLLEWLADAEVKLRFFGSLPEDDESTKQEIAEHTKFLNEMEEKESLKNTTLELAEDILKKCHPDGITVIRHWITIIKSRWDEISSWAKQRDQRLHNHLQSLKYISDLLENLLSWLLDAESTLLVQEKEALPDDITVLDNLIKEHQVFMNNMSTKQADVDKVSKAFSKHPKSKGIVKDKTKEKFPRSGPTGPQKTSTPSSAEIDKYIKHPRAKLLLEKWWIVWILAMERQRRLQDRRQYLMEVDKIKHFDFDDWRNRYLGWLNNKKSRIMEQFKKIDKNNVGKVTKEEFIDGILKSKFVTSRLEMERVADIFDRNGDGFIDSKEYIETLRPEKEGKPKTEDEKIQDEVQRQVSKCTCVHRFKVYQVGEGKYRFGDSQKLRLVRILRSTVMVRVGGGWVALDEFLVKNDPCRAKGRTNLELREQFILADGVSQSMTPFKPKASPNSSVPFQSGSTNSISSAGPITKIREKSERSTPMKQSRSSAEHTSDISDLSFSETDSFSNRSGLSRTPTSSRPNLRNTNGKSSSRPSSRQGSRAPSDLSQDGIEEYTNKHKRMTVENSKKAEKLDLLSSGKTNKTQPETSKIPSAKKTLKQIKITETPK